MAAAAAAAAVAAPMLCAQNKNRTIAKCWFKIMVRVLLGFLLNGFFRSYTKADGTMKFRAIFRARSTYY